MESNFGHAKELKILNELLKIAVKMKASDLHLMKGQPPSIRISTDLQCLDLENLSSAQVKALTYSILNSEQIQKFEKDLELDFSHEIPGIARFRGNLMMQKGTISGAYRVVPFEVPIIDNLGLPNQVKDLANTSRGLILITGPTGSGKSTTMAAILDVINSTRSLNIVTIEDPMEFVHKNKKSFIRQREVGFDTHSFNSALIKVLRHDPDVIQIGEMRDLESIGIALTAAETGHLVLSTLHTQTAPLSISRIVDVFPSESREQVRRQLANSLKAIVSQQLLPLKDSKGKILATELLMNVPAVKNLIRMGNDHQLYSVMQTSMDSGMHTMDTSIFSLYSQGKISRETALEYCVDTGETTRMMNN